MAPERCVSAGGAAAVSPSAASCGGDGSSGSGGWGHGSRTLWGSSGGNATPAAATERGGFGSFARSIGAHIGG
jgi:hypothetical protein